MNPYTGPKETKVGANRPKIQHLAEDAAQGRTRRERQMEKEGVASARRAIKKSARRHLKQQLLSELEEDPTVTAARAFTLRPATLADRDALRLLIAQSARELSADYYEPHQVEAALQGAFGVDTNLIEDGTYFVAESEGALIGCGGWSGRKTMFGADEFNVRDAAFLDPKSEAARIRAFFVHPAWARKGVGRAILERCETEAAGAGFNSFELMATLPGVPFYLASNYQKRPPARFTIGSGVEIEFVPMEKRLA